MQEEGSGFLLSILFFVVMAIVGLLVFFILNLLMKKVVIRYISSFTIDRGYKYLTDNDEKYQEERAFGACTRELALRFAILLVIHGVLFVACLFLIPEEWVFWVVPEGSIRAGFTIGTFVCFIVQATSAFSVTLQVGRLTKIDEDGVGWFADALGGEFSVDIGGCFPYGEYPTTGDCYVVMNRYPKYLFLRPIECERAWRRR